MLDVIFPAQVAPLVPRICEPVDRPSSCLAATPVAVDLSSVITLADEELFRAQPAVPLEEHELVHPSRRDENWTAASGPITVRTYWLSIRRLYMRAQAANLGPPSFPPLSDVQGRPQPREFLTSLLFHELAG
jgi:hypothetical protein